MLCPNIFIPQPLSIFYNDTIIWYKNTIYLTKKGHRLGYPIIYYWLADTFLVQCNEFNVCGILLAPDVLVKCFKRNCKFRLEHRGHYLFVDFYLTIYFLEMQILFFFSTIQLNILNMYIYQNMKLPVIFAVLYYYKT